MKYVFPEYKRECSVGQREITVKSNVLSGYLRRKGDRPDTQEFEVLYLLALKPNWVMPKTNIYHSVWGIHYHDDQIPYRTVEYVIWKIRKKMGHDIIETLVNVGYRLKKVIVFGRYN